MLLPEAAGAHLDLRADGRAVADARRELDAQRTDTGFAARCARPRGRTAPRATMSTRPSPFRSPVASDVASASDAAMAGGMARRGDIGPFATEVAEEARAARGQQEEVEQAVVVVVDELRGAGVGGFGRRWSGREAAAGRRLTAITPTAFRRGKKKSG